jgi:hypothetical protein
MKAHAQLLTFYAPTTTTTTKTTPSYTNDSDENNNNSKMQFATSPEKNLFSRPESPTCLEGKIIDDSKFYKYKIKGGRVRI